MNELAWPRPPRDALRVGSPPASEAPSTVPPRRPSPMPPWSRSNSERPSWGEPLSGAPSSSATACSHDHASEKAHCRSESDPRDGRPLASMSADLSYRHKKKSGDPTIGSARFKCPFPVCQRTAMPLRCISLASWAASET